MSNSFFFHTACMILDFNLKTLKDFDCHDIKNTLWQADINN